MLNSLFCRAAWRPSRAAKTALGLALLSSSALGQQVNQSLSIGDLSSGYNREMFWLALWAIVISIIIFVGVSWALFYTVQKFREDKNDAAPAQFHGNNRLEVTLVAVPVVIVIVLALLTVRAMARLNPTPAGAYPVTAVAAQFYWNFEYPNVKVDAAAGTGLVTNGNEMIVPSKTKIAVTATSRDVIHGFWVPNLGGQRDAIPSVKKTWQIDNDKAGVYQGNCTVLCGASHANMRFKVIALPEAEYQQFVSAAQAYKAPVAAAGTAAAAGYTIFMQGKGGAGACAACHRVQGTAAAGQSGPDLSFFGSRRTLGAGVWEGADVDTHLHQWIKASSSIKPGSVMPHYDGSTQGYPTLTDQELTDLEAYLKTLQLPDEGNYWMKISALVPDAPVPAAQNPTPSSVNAITSASTAMNGGK
ncbi:cytochrome c oxidase subunit II [Deinococcus psychrotolerans]|uniref:Cytochrome c oxidase subunit 2 n=1 Tax=Deinococcus psychrotolerans TaxID=2489213 RepID=A0A3G8YJD4_9DEIO|nr:cytochrome c oxidase subunit II [Deinococcus psychrotolerans]AZI41551.1 cytochrome c oxidase subunit II [Deinococcus psychrotolerans]